MIILWHYRLFWRPFSFSIFKKSAYPYFVKTIAWLFLINNALPTSQNVSFGEHITYIILVQFTKKALSVIWDVYNLWRRITHNNVCDLVHTCASIKIISFLFMHNWTTAYSLLFAQRTQEVKSIQVQRWSSVVDGGPTLNQHWFNVLCLLVRDRTRLCLAFSYFQPFQRRDRISTSEPDVV